MLQSTENVVMLLICLRIIFLPFVGAAAVKIWVIFVAVWMHGGHYQWSWSDARFILVNGGLLAIVFCIFATISHIKNRP